MAFVAKLLKSRRLRWIFFLLGLILFGFLIARSGPRVIGDYWQQMGLRFGWILGLHLVLYIGYAWGWEIFLKTLNTRVQFWQIFKIKVAGEAVNNISPLGWGGGDPARVYFLKHHIPLAEGTASVVVDRTLNNFAVVLFLWIGIVLAFLKVPMTPPLKIGLVFLLALFVFSSLLLYFRSREGLFAFLLAILKFLRIKKTFSDKTRQTVREIDGHISHFYLRNKKGFWVAFLINFAGRLVAIVEIYLIAYFLNYPLTWSQSYLLGSMTVIVNLLFIFIPGALGIMEGAYTGVFALFGLNPAVGTSIQIVRRARMLIWTAIGFVLMAGIRAPASEPVVPQIPD